MPHVVVNGARLWYEVRGEGEPLLLHHGYTASRVNWMPVAERLQSKYQVILMECRGTGESEHTSDGYTLEQYAADVIGVADHLGLAKFTYAGHSMGGGIGYVLALTYPERLSRLILMAAVPADGFPGNAPAQVEGVWCLDPNESLSPGQAQEIDRVWRAYPHLNDDVFVRENLDGWLGD